jgi:hypothetical protein
MINPSFNPDCPICQHNQQVEKVSTVVEKIFASPPANGQKTTRVVWAGRFYYIPASLIKPLSKPVGNTWLLFGGPAFERLFHNMVKVNLSLQLLALRYDQTRMQQLAKNKNEALSGLLLLPVLENPGPLPTKPAFWRFFKEFVIWRGYWFLAVMALLVVGIIQHLTLVVLVSLVLLVLLFLLGLVFAVVCKIAVAFLTQAEQIYRQRRHKLAKAEDRWNRLYYCHLHNGVFSVIANDKLIEINQLDNYLFADDEKTQ